MPTCVSCSAEILPDSQFCEACGHRVGEPVASKDGKDGPKATGPGSLRGEVAFLAGSVDKAKVRLENWRQKGDQAKLQAEREASIQKQEKELEQAEQTKKKRGIVNTLTQIVIGLAALAAFVFLLLRMPRRSLSPHAMMCLYQNLLEFMQEEFGLADSP